MNKRKWTILDQNTFQLETGNEEILSFEVTYNSFVPSAKVQVGSESYTLSKKGFLLNKIQVLNDFNEIILTAKPKKWYSDKWIFQYDGHSYELKVSNNPMTEWSIIHNDAEVAAIGLKLKDGQLIMDCYNTTNHFIMDCLLWFVFYPVAVENFSFNFRFELT